MICIDSETTGVDFYHGARPFFVTICEDGRHPIFYEWDVDPETRQPIIPDGDVEDIQEYIDNNTLVLQNAKFDARALSTIGINPDWPWDKTHDTLISSHLLASNRPKDLTSLVLMYAGDDIEPYELALKEACVSARRVVRRDFPTWKVAKRLTGTEYEDVSVEVEPGNMPSVKEKSWKYDTWLPRAIAQEMDYAKPDSECEHLWPGWECSRCNGHGWWTVLSEYANRDSAYTLAVFKRQVEELKSRGLWEIYLERLKVIRVAYRMEARGITLSKTRLDELQAEFSQESNRLGGVCVGIAESLGYDLKLPKAGNNASLVNFCFGTPIGNAHDFVYRGQKIDPELGRIQSNCLALPVVKKSKKTGEPSLDKEAMDTYRASLPEHTKQLLFVNKLVDKRSRDTAIQYMEGYKRYWVPLGIYNKNGEQCWYCLHPNLNPTGTATLRWSCTNPNEQNISKKVEACRPCNATGKFRGKTCIVCGGRGEKSLNIRYCFGPAPDREWWTCDAKNIERRFPAYDCKETDITNLFERPNDPPYYGSEHLLVAHLLHPQKFEECRDEKGELDGRIFKKRYAATLYQWVKNGNFAIQYGCMEAMADRTYHVTGAFKLLKQRFKKQEEVNQYWIDFANKHGYVETVPDKTVNPKRGYPLLCLRTERGNVKPTIPFNYRYSGSAMWWMQKAMVRCEAQLEQWRTQGFDGWMIMQVHDELAFDFPKSSIHPKEDTSKFRRSNLWRVKVLQKLMEQGGDDMGLPTPVGVEFHEDNWSVSVSF